MNSGATIYISGNEVVQENSDCLHPNPTHNSVTDDEIDGEEEMVVRGPSL